MQFPKREKFEGSAVVNVFLVGRHPNSDQENCGLNDYECLRMQISSFENAKPRMFKLFVTDCDFIHKTRSFYGEIKIVYDSGWAMLMEASNLGLVKVIFCFPKEVNGKQESLSAYIDGKMLPTLCKYFLPNLAT